MQALLHFTKLHQTLMYVTLLFLLPMLLLNDYSYTSQQFTVHILSIYGSACTVLCIYCLLQLQEKFGWDAFKKVFAAYHSISNAPNNRDGKMNLYAETFSKAVNMNLSAFFKAWGWPIQHSTEEALSSLPMWSDHPMAQYAQLPSLSML